MCDEVTKVCLILLGRRTANDIVPRRWTPSQACDPHPIPWIFIYRSGPLTYCSPFASVDWITAPGR